MLQRGGNALALVIGALTLLFAVNAEAQSNEVMGTTTVERSLARLSTSLALSRVGTVLVVGSSSTVGIGASSPLNAYVARLEVNLEHALQGLDFRVVGRGVSGEVAQVLLVDRFGAMRGWSRDRAYLSKDNLHMNDEGYARLAEQIASKIVTALPRNGLVLTAIR